MDKVKIGKFISGLRKEKDYLGVTIKTIDTTPFMFDRYHDKETKTYVIDNLFRYLDKDNLKYISPTTTVFFVKDM